MRHQIVDQIIQSGAVAVIRMSDAQRLERVIGAIRAGGVTNIEITMTTPGALQVIEQTSRAFAGDSDVLVGVGSVLDAMTARRAVEAGAKFVVGPALVPEVIQMAHQYDVPVMPGAFTPTEIHRAMELGADIVKVFPADVVGMPFFKAVLAPMPHAKLMPTGGVTLTNAGEWLLAGACAVGVGSALLEKAAIDAEDYTRLTENARTLCRSIDQTRTP